MELDSQWQAFAQTGDIRRYLNYRQQVRAAAQAAQEGSRDGCDRNPGAGSSGSQIP